MFVIYFVFALIIACENFKSILNKQGNLNEQGSLNEQGDLNEQSNLNEQGNLNEQDSSDKIEISEFTVKIKDKNTGGHWIDLGTLVVRKEENGIATGLNTYTPRGGHSATFFSIEESEVSNFVKAMTENGSFVSSLYYGYGEENSLYGYSKTITTKIEEIDHSKYITFSGDRIKDSGCKIDEYTMPLEDIKNSEDEIKDSGCKIAEYAIPLEDLKKNLKYLKYKSLKHVKE